MIKPEEVQHLVDAHEKVRKALDEQKAPRLAAKILCDELRGLVKGNESFWSGIRDASKSLSEQRKLTESVFVSISDFIDAEGRIFADLGIDQSRSTPIFGLVCDGLNVAGIGNLDFEPSPANLRILRDLVGRAADSVCKISKGPVQHAREWLVSWRGARVLAGAATSLANAAAVPAAIAVGPAAIPSILHGGVVCWMSIKVGVKVMKGDLEGILDLVKPQ